MKALVPVIATAVALFAAPAFAQTYMAVGYTNVAADDDTVDVSLGALSAVVGTHFNEHFGAEGEGALGVAEDTMDVLGYPVDVKLNYEVGAYVVGFVPLGDKVELFGRVGVTSAGVEASALGSTVKDSGSGVAYGFGIQGFANGHVGGRLAYTRSEALGANELSIAAAFRF